MYVQIYIHKYVSFDTVFCLGVVFKSTWRWHCQEMASPKRKQIERDLTGEENMHFLQQTDLSHFLKAASLYYCTPLLNNLIK